MKHYPSSTPTNSTNPPGNAIHRRQFLQQAAMGSFALVLPKLPVFANSTSMGIVVHSYGSRWNSKVTSHQYPGFSNAIDLVEHCKELGAGGVQVVVTDWTNEFSKKVRTASEKANMYLEGSIGVPATAQDAARFEKEVVNAKEAGARVLRTVCSSGRRYENYHSMEAFRQLQKNALTSLQIAEPILRKHKIKLAVENHKDWRAPELESMMKTINSEWIGVTLDFGNSISLLEDPMEVIQTLAPFAISTHVKDMALEEYVDGFLLAEVPLGKGILDLPKIIALCKKHNPNITFNLEMITRDPLEIPCLKKDYWSTFDGLPGSELARMLRMVREHKSASPLPRISQLQPEERLAIEEQNIVACMNYSREVLGLTS